MLKFKILVLLTVAAMMIFPQAATRQIDAQDDQFPPVLQYEYNHTMRINGEEAVAHGVGELNFEEGYILLQTEITNYIDGYSQYASSVVTNAGGGGGGGDVAIVLEGAVNLRELMEDGLSYTATAYTQDDYVDLVTEFEVTQDGDLVIANVVTEGEANYPLITGMDGPVQITQIPTTDGFIEVGTKRLITEDNEIILSSMYVEYEGIPLDQPQHRELSVEVLEISDDALNLTLQYNGVLSPIDGPRVEYTNEMNINGETAIATATGFADRVSGVIFVNAEIERYIEGYPTWCVSPVTTILQTLSPAFSFPLEDARVFNEIDAYTSVINVEDGYSTLEITANIEIEGESAVAHLVTEGEASYPAIVCPNRMRMSFSQEPLDDLTVREEGVKVLLSEEGEPIEVPMVATFSGAALEQSQSRFIEVIATDVSEDQHNISLIYRSVTMPQ